MTSASALVAWCYDATGQLIQARVQWLVDQRDLLVPAQFGGGKSAASLINAAGNGKTAGFQIDLSGPEKLEVITDALETLGVIPAIALPVVLTHAGFARLER